MNLYIQIENGQPINHPAFEENLIQAFGAVPDNWEKFIRLEPPALGSNQVFDNPRVIYEKVNGTWTDVYQIRDMTLKELEEKKLKEIEYYKGLWNSLPQRDNFSSWVFNEETIKYEPPIPRPTDREVIWHGASNSWVDRPIKPDDGKEYIIDFYTLSWVEVSQ
jgi:hypothetical protein